MGSLLAADLRASPYILAAKLPPSFLIPHSSFKQSLHTQSKDGMLSKSFSTISKQQTTNNHPQM